MLTDEELTWFNDYHRLVYDRLQALLDDDDRAWLKEATAPLTR
jgi:Xaa-Pro aminopeptidase